MLVSERVTTTPRATSQQSPEIHLDFGESLVTSRPAAPVGIGTSFQKHQNKQLQFLYIQ